MSVPSVRPIWTPEDARLTAELAAEFPTEVGIIETADRWNARLARIRRALTSWPVITLLPLLIIPVGLANPPRAQADPGVGCQTVVWGFLASQRRTLCDGPIFADGSWNRARVVWTPAHQVPINCYGGYWSTSCSGGYFVSERVNSSETYPVTPATVLPDEPGHISVGSLT